MGHSSFSCNSVSYTHLDVYKRQVNECFKTHDSISKSTLMETFNGVLTEKQVRNLISRMEQSGIIKRIGVGKATKYIKDWDKFKKYI